MLSELVFPHIRCCLSAIPSDLKKSTVVDESLSSMNQQFCSRENQLLQSLQQNEKSTSEKTPFLAIEQPDMILIPMLQKLGPRTPDLYMAVLWNPGDQTVILKKEHDYWICKRITLYGKRSHGPTRKCWENYGNTTSHNIF